jgi:phosphoglucosamine mutase
MTVDFALRLASSAARVLAPAGGRALVGKDTRLSGYMFEAALEAGFVGAGVDVDLIGPLPTPAIAYLTQKFDCRFGVVISASHNLYDDNGIKFFDGAGSKLSDDLEEAIERELENPVVTRESKALGRATRIDKSRGVYQEFCASTLPKGMDLRGLKIVIDCANGAAYKVAPTVLWELEADVIQVGVHPDGFNINRDCGSNHPEHLRSQVLAHNADLGIALDGDADRLALVDEKGDTIDGDQIMALIAESWRTQGRLRGGGVVATIMSNLGLERHLAGLGLNLVRAKVGDRYVLEQMREGNFNVGGEQSGHVILSDYTTTGDGLIAALQVLSVIAESGRPASEVCRRFKPLPQILRNIRYGGGRPLDDPQVKAAIEHGHQRLGEGGRLSIRRSGTEAVIRVMAQGDDQPLISDVVNEIVAAIERVTA